MELQGKPSDKDAEENQTDQEAEPGVGSVALRRVGEWHAQLLLWPGRVDRFSVQGLIGIRRPTPPAGRWFPAASVHAGITAYDESYIDPSLHPDRGTPSCSRIC